MNRRVYTSPTWVAHLHINMPLQNVAVRKHLIKMRKELTVTALWEEITVLVKGKITVS